MTVLEKLQECDNINPIVFNDYKDFKPDFTPVQMGWLGVFKGGYFSVSLIEEHKAKKANDINNGSYEYLNYLEFNFPDEINESKNMFFGFHNNLHNKNNDKSINLFGVDCGSSYMQWIDRNWIFKIDPYGWYNWYINFYYGRRDKCDATQIARWKSFKARHSGMLKSRCKPNEIDKCLKTRQNLLHWAIDSTKI